MEDCQNDTQGVEVTQHKAGLLYRNLVFGKKGFSLMEVAITMAVVTLALLGLLSVNTMMQRTSHAVYERSVAMQHAGQVVEQMRNLSTTSLANVTDTFPNGQVVNAAQYSTAATEVLPNEVVLTNYVNTAANPLDVTVTVNWNSLGVRASTASLRTLVARRA